MLKYSPPVYTVKYTHANSQEQGTITSVVQAQEQDHLLALCHVTFHCHFSHSRCDISYLNLTSCIITYCHQHGCHGVKGATQTTREGELAKRIHCTSMLDQCEL